MRPVEALGDDPRAVIQDDCEYICEHLGGRASRLAGKTVLITGAAGMSAAYLADAIVHLNDTRRLARPVRACLVVRSPDSNEGRLTHMRGRADVRFVIADAATPFAVDEPAHFLIHAASAASPAAYRRDPLGTLAVNSAGTRHVLDLAHRWRAESVLFLSTSEVYGSPPAKDIPTPETFVGTTRWLGGRACYVEGKRFGEALCAAAGEQLGTPVKIVRPFHFHGPGLRLGDGRVVAELIRMGMAGERVALKSDGRATRTYGYLADATVAFLRVLLSDENGEVFNVGVDGPETSVLELAAVVSRLFGRTEPVLVGTDRAAGDLAGAPDRACPDLTKLRGRVGLGPTIPLEDGLRRTIHWHRTRAAGHSAAR